jgi:hypothetical protein
MDKLPTCFIKLKRRYPMRLHALKRKLVTRRLVEGRTIAARYYFYKLETDDSSCFCNAKNFKNVACVLLLY